MSEINNLQKELDILKLSFTKEVSRLREKYFVSPSGLLVINTNKKSVFDIGFSVDVGLLKNPS